MYRNEGAIKTRWNSSPPPPPAEEMNPPVRLTCMNKAMHFLYSGMALECKLHASYIRCEKRAHNCSAEVTKLKKLKKNTLRWKHLEVYFFLF